MKKTLTIIALVGSIGTAVAGGNEAPKITQFTGLNDHASSTLTIVGDKSLKLTLTGDQTHQVPNLLTGGVSLINNAFDLSAVGTGDVGPIVVEADPEHRNDDGSWSLTKGGIKDENTLVSFAIPLNSGNCVARDNTTSNSATTDAKFWRHKNGAATDSIWCDAGYDLKNYKLQAYFKQGGTSTIGKYTLKLTARELMQ